MINILLAGIRVGIDNQYDLMPWLRGWLTRREPDFTIRVSPEELLREDDGQGFPPAYLEFICCYRHIAERLADFDAFVFHSAALAVDRRAYLFAAPSGTGKTTHAQSWLNRVPGVSVLNGDKPILRRTPEAFIACGTPWQGKERFGSDSNFPIQGICLLQRGSEDRIRPAEPALAVPRLSRQVYFPRDPVRLEKTLSLMDACFRSVPLWSMACTLDPDSGLVSYEAMRPRARDGGPVQNEL